jgi:hypothetical protein
MLAAALELAESIQSRQLQRLARSPICRGRELMRFSAGFQKGTVW